MVPSSNTDRKRAFHACNRGSNPRGITIAPRGASGNGRANDQNCRYTKARLRMCGLSPKTISFLFSKNYQSFLWSQDFLDFVLVYLC